MNRHLQSILRLAVLIVLVGTIPSLTLAQNAAGRIIGNVTDPTGAAVPGAEVTVTNDATHVSQHVVTDESGHYQVPLLPIGTYTVTIEKESFPGYINYDGLPGNYYFNPTSFSNAQCGDVNDPPPCTPGPAIFPSDAQVVANPLLATYGTVPRNFLRGPRLTNVDLAVSKTTAWWQEKLKLELRFEFFNLFNHPEFSNPDTNINSPTFGQILSTADPRIIQIAARVTF